MEGRHLWAPSREGSKPNLTAWNKKVPSLFSSLLCSVSADGFLRPVLNATETNDSTALCVSKCLGRISFCTSKASFARPEHGENHWKSLWNCRNTSVKQCKWQSLLISQNSILTICFLRITICHLRLHLAFSQIPTWKMVESIAGCCLREWERASTHQDIRTSSIHHYLWCTCIFPRFVESCRVAGRFPGRFCIRRFIFHLPALAFKALMDFWKAGWLKATSWARSSKITWCNMMQHNATIYYSTITGRKNLAKWKQNDSIAIKEMKSDAMPVELRQQQRSCSLPSRLRAFERRQCKPLLWKSLEKYSRLILSLYVIYIL